MTKAEKAWELRETAERTKEFKAYLQNAEDYYEKHGFLTESVLHYLRSAREELDKLRVAHEEAASELEKGGAA